LSDMGKYSLSDTTVIYPVVYVDTLKIELYLDHQNRSFPTKEVGLL
jgi:hypothetical protein